MENIDINKIEEYEDKAVLGYHYFNGLRRPCNGGIFVSEDKELYEYTVFFNDYDKGNSYFRKIKKLRKIEYMQVLAFIKWRIGKKEFKIMQGTDGGSTVIVNYKNIKRKIEFSRELSEEVYKLLNGFIKKSNH